MKLKKKTWMIRWWVRWFVPLPLIVWYLHKRMSTCVIYQCREFRVVGVGKQAILTKLIQVRLEDISEERDDVQV